MPFRVSLLALLLCVAAASAAELKTLKGEVLTGDVVSINAKELVIDVAGEKKTFAVGQIAGVDYNKNAKLPIDAKWTDVELVDGTLLRCSAFELKKTTVTVKLLGSEAEVKMPLDIVANVLHNAQDPALRKAWDARVSMKRTHDAVAVDNGGVLNAIECTILETDEKGVDLTFKLKSSGKDVTKPLAAFAGLLFQRRLNPAAPPIVCKLMDIGQSSLMVASVETKNGDLLVKTSAGVEILYKPAQMVRLDYSSGNLAYLSDLTPSKVIETSTEDRVEHYRKDRNIDDHPIRLLSKPYAKGLALHSTTELEFKLKGEYRTLQGIAGIDDQVGGHNRPVVLRIYADDGTTVPPPLIFEKSFSRKNQAERVKPINLNIKDAQSIRIVVTYEEGDFLDTGLHLDLADIRVIK